MITLRPRPTTCHPSDPASSTKFCPRCGGPSTWVRADAVHEDALARTVCARCAPALAAWLADEHDPAGFVDVALAAPWRAALRRFDHSEVAARAERDAQVALAR